MGLIAEIEPNSQSQITVADTPEEPNSKKEFRGDDYAFLRQAIPDLRTHGREFRSVDLFCGAGGLTLGVREAVYSLGGTLKTAYAADMNEAAAACFERNFSVPVIRDDLTTIFNIDGQKKLSNNESKLRSRVDEIDLLMGGPPCQGHSDLNNYSRRDDPKNKLYLVMSRAAMVMRPRHIIIENVPGVAHDKGGAFAQTVAELVQLGYEVDWGIVDSSKFGVAQVRKRLILVASLGGLSSSVAAIIEKYTLGERNVKWAIGDIENNIGVGLMNQAVNPTATTKKRIDYLFDHDLFDLPDSERPACHQKGGHSYRSIYGRIDYSKPSQTVTGGFFNMSMGRNVHPSKRRTLTAHEAARLQFFPDYFDFSPAAKRTVLAQIIGNAVPPKLSYPFARELLNG